MSRADAPVGNVIGGTKQETMNVLCLRVLMDKYVAPLSKGFLGKGQKGQKKVKVSDPGGFSGQHGREEKIGLLPISWAMNKNTMDLLLVQVFPNETAQLIKSSHHYRG